MLNHIKDILAKIFLPIRINATFFVMMYVLGVVCAWVTLPDTPSAELYDNLYIELFLDLYVVCLLLALIPHKIRVWVKGFLYTILYSVAIVDAYCFVKFGSVITPSILMLIGETNSREAGEFITTYISGDVVLSDVGWILLILLVHIVVKLVPVGIKYLHNNLRMGIDGVRNSIINILNLAQPILGLACLALLVNATIVCSHNKVLTWQLINDDSIGSIEHKFIDKDHAMLYTPIYRLIFSMHANSLVGQQITQLINATNNVKMDSCTYRSPNIVLIIGESYGKHHSQQYGYFMPTTPYQVEMESKGNLVKFTDVVSQWNLTSYVFRSVFSMKTANPKGEWYDYPLFPELFRKAGYHVSFITNQFLPQAKSAIYDFTGGFFLNNPTLSKAQFDTRNTSLHTFDESLISDYKRLKPKNSKYNLTIFHLIGQHVMYASRSPESRKQFTADDYATKRPELTQRQREILADYDNATLYNDSVVYAICQQFKDKDAIVIYMPDHGEECYEGRRNFFCRNHSAQIDYDLARYEFEVPFWAWCSDSYKAKHPDVFNDLKMAHNRRFMTNMLSQMLLHLAGIYTPDYHEQYDVLSPKYDQHRPRMLREVIDYDKLRANKNAKTKS